jgi:hypothetical protein
VVVVGEISIGVNLVVVVVEKEKEGGVIIGG